MLFFPENITTRMQLGMWAEAVVAAELRRSGYDVRKQKRADGGDLYACGLKIEVKASMQCHDGRFRYCLKKSDKYGHTDHERADVVILLAIGASGLVQTLVIPSEALTDKSNMTLPKLRGYHGRYAEYKKPIISGLRRFMN